MFTLKLYRRHPTDGAIQMKVISVHRVKTNEIGKKNEGGQFVALELWAEQEDRSYEKYYVGQPTEGMTAYGRNDLHLDSDDGSFWGWGLLENWEGNTTQHFRPASYG